MINITNEGLKIFNVIPVFRGARVVKFISSVSIKDIGEVYDKLKYDENTQRGYVKRKMRKQIKTQQIKSKKNIQEMQEKILNGFFDGGTLTWNVRVKDDKIESAKEKYEFNIDEGSLLIKGNITLPDSAQRHEVLNNLKDYTLSINPENYCFPLQVSLYTLEEEQNLFSEINGEGQRASKTRSLYLSNATKSLLLKDIISQTFFKDNIEVKTGISYTKGLVTNFAILYNSLFEGVMGAYKNLQEDELKEFSQWIIRFYNHLEKVRPNLGKLDVDERRKNHNESLETSKPAFYAYAYLAKCLRGDTNWKRKLNGLNREYRAGMWEGDIFDINNPLWHGTVCIKNDKEEWKVVNSKKCIKFVVNTLLKHLNIIEF